MQIDCKISLKLNGRIVDGEDCIISITPNSIKCIFSCPQKTQAISYILGRLNGADEEVEGIVHPEDVISFYDMKVDGINKNIVVDSFQINPKPSAIKITINSITENVEIKFKKIILKEASNDVQDVLYFNHVAKNILHNNSLNVNFNNKNYCFSYDMSSNIIALSYNKEDSDSIKKLILLLSLYYRVPMQYYRHDYTEEGFKYMSFRRTRFNEFENSFFNPLDILELKDISNIQDFIDSAKIERYFSKGDLFERVVNNYVNSQYYDVIGEFISLCLSIICLDPLLVPKSKELKKILAKKDISEFDRVTYLFYHLHLNGGSKIDFKKINAPLMNLKVDMTTDRDNGKHIETFIDLRNEIIHGLQSNEIYNFLEDDNTLITNLELLNVVMILNMLGIKKIAIAPYFKHFNIFGEMDFNDLVIERFSCRKYTDEPVKKEDIEYVMECVRLAPSATNRQPWKFLIITSEEAKAKIRQCYNREWFATAPMYSLCMMAPNDCWVRKEDNKSHADIDLGIAIEHLCLAATDRGLGTCWVCNFEVETTKRLFPVEGFEPVAIVPIGHIAPDCPHPEKSRKEMNEITEEI